MNLSEIFKKKGINGFEDLNESEKQTFRQWEAILNSPDVTINDLKAILPKELERANAELRKHENSKDKDSFYKAYTTLCEFLLTTIAAFVAVLKWTGLRVRDVVQLKRSAVDEKYVTVRTHKNRKPVRVRLHPEAKEALAKLKPVGEYWFWSGMEIRNRVLGIGSVRFGGCLKIAGVNVNQST